MKKLFNFLILLSLLMLLYSCSEKSSTDTTEDEYVLYTPKITISGLQNDTFFLPTNAETLFIRIVDSVESVDIDTFYTRADSVVSIVLKEANYDSLIFIVADANGDTILIGWKTDFIITKDQVSTMGTVELFQNQIFPVDSITYTLNDSNEVVIEFDYPDSLLASISGFIFTRNNINRDSGRTVLDTVISTETHVTYTDKGLDLDTIFYYAVEVYSILNDTISEYTKVFTRPRGATFKSYHTVMDTGLVSVNWSLASNYQAGVFIYANGILETTLYGSDQSSYSYSLSSGGVQDTTYLHIIVFTEDTTLSWPSDSEVFVPIIPAKPENLKLDSLTDSELYISWIDQAFNESGFIVYVNNSPLITSGNYTIDSAANTGDTLHYTISGLSPDTLYTIAIKATGATGTSDFISKTMRTYPVAPGVPATFDTLAGNSAVTDQTVILEWGDVSNEDGFNIYYKKNSESLYTLFASTDSNVLTETVTGLSPNESYSFLVASFNRSGIYYFPDTIFANTKQADIVGPGSSFDVLTIFSESIWLVWNDSADNEFGYRVKWYPLNNPADSHFTCFANADSLFSNDTSCVDTIAADASNYTINGTTPNRSYEIIIVAYNDEKISSPDTLPSASDAVEVKTPMDILIQNNLIGTANGRVFLGETSDDSIYFTISDLKADPDSGTFLLAWTAAVNTAGDTTYPWTEIAADTTLWCK